MAPRDLAYVLGTDKRTVERWESGKVYPQLANRKALAAKLESLELADLQPDLEAEEREVRDQLDKIEQKTLDILSQVSELAARVEAAVSLPADQSDSEESAATDSDGEHRLIP